MFLTFQNYFNLKYKQCVVVAVVRNISKSSELFQITVTTILNPYLTLPGYPAGEVTQLCPLSYLPL